MNTMIRNRKACMTAAIPVNLVLQEVKTMKKKNHTLSIKLKLLNQMSFMNDTSPNNFTRVTLGDWLGL